MTLREVAPGDPLNTDHRTWNAFIRAARRAEELPTDTPPLATATFGHQNTVRIVNTSSTTLKRGYIVGLINPSIRPDANLDTFIQRLACNATLPFDNLALGVVTVPCAQGKPGRAAVDGLAAIRVLIRKAEHDYARPVEDTFDHLESCEAGPVKILWRESFAEGGTVWCIVQLGDMAPTPIIAGTLADDLLASNEYATLENLEAIGGNLDDDFATPPLIVNNTLDLAGSAGRKAIATYNQYDQLWRLIYIRPPNTVHFSAVLNNDLPANSAIAQLANVHALGALHDFPAEPFAAHNLYNLAGNAGDACFGIADLDNAAIPFRLLDVQRKSLWLIQSIFIDDITNPASPKVMANRQRITVHSDENSNEDIVIDTMTDCDAS